VRLIFRENGAQVRLTDVAIAALIRRLLAAGAGVEGVRMLKRIAERDIRRRSGAGDETALAEAALRILYQRKAFREETRHGRGALPPRQAATPNRPLEGRGTGPDLKATGGRMVPSTPAHGRE
jgi:hypothetical protein